MCIQFSAGHQADHSSFLSTRIETGCSFSGLTSNLGLGLIAFDCWLCIWCTLGSTQHSRLLMLTHQLKPQWLSYILTRVLQVDQAHRGFSFLKEAPLDMRMGPSAAASAEQILNSWSEAELGQIFREYGEERHWKGIASRCVWVCWLLYDTALGFYRLFCSAEPCIDCHAMLLHSLIACSIAIICQCALNAGHATPVYNTAHDLDCEPNRPEQPLYLT